MFSDHLSELDSYPVRWDVKWELTDLPETPKGLTKELIKKLKQP